MKRRQDKETGVTKTTDNFYPKQSATLTADKPWVEMGKSGILGSSEITQNSLELKSVKSYLYFYGRPPLHTTQPNDSQNL